MMEICAEGFDRLTDSTQSLDRLGELLNEQWKLKRSLINKISNKDVDLIYATGIEAGALGGKLLGWTARHIISWKMFIRFGCLPLWTLSSVAANILPNPCCIKIPFYLLNRSFRFARIKV